MENSLNIFIVEFSDFNNKLTSLEKLSPLQEFSSGIVNAFVAPKITDLIKFLDNNEK